ncbi:hypothetical protein C2E23DRAFT_854788 [Lenzites betulinus]|nr:hypothetical protein C2E23DRAFT_854788 [Lenzites betulinus]
MAASPQNIPDGFVLDVHDLAAIILHTHALSEPLFAHAQLVEVGRGDSPLKTFPEHFLHSSWYETASGPDARKRVAYILRKDQTTVERTTIDTFASLAGVKAPTASELTRRELEDAFWRCKTFNSGYLLAYVAQQVFDNLPPPPPSSRARPQNTRCAASLAKSPSPRSTSTSKSRASSSSRSRAPTSGPRRWT